MREQREWQTVVFAKEAYAAQEAEEGMEINDAEIRRQSAGYGKVHNLMYCVDESSLTEEHRKQKKKKAVVMDGVNKSAYDKQAGKNLLSVVERIGGNTRTESLHKVHD